VVAQLLHPQGTRRSSNVQALALQEGRSRVEPALRCSRASMPSWPVAASSLMTASRRHRWLFG